MLSAPLITAASAYMATPRVPAYVEKHAGILLGMLQAFTQSLPALPNTARGSGKHTVLHGQLQIWSAMSMEAGFIYLTILQRLQASNLLLPSH